MLTVIRSMKDLRFAALMEIYAESNQANGSSQWPRETRDRRIALAEEEFYRYLSQCFFPVQGAVYFVWQAEERWVSALRVEPYLDGLLLTALETAPSARNKGYASALVGAALTWLGEQGRCKVYSHIAHQNKASIAVHEHCGFRRIRDTATTLDGSVTQRLGTYLYQGTSEMECSCP